jgi:signal transduction histidine kinase
MLDGAAGERGITAADLFGSAAEEGVFDLAGDEPGAWTEALLARWEEEEIPPFTLRLFDGRSFELNDRRSADGDIVSAATDMTEVVAREAALREARHNAEATARAKTQFLARMSHEMRTPLNGVIGMAELLGESRLDEDARVCADTIRNSAGALLAIVNDVLDLSRSEAGRMRFESAPFDLEALLLDCLRLASAAGRVETKGLDMALAYPLDAPRRLLGDEGRIRQVILNLLGNAVKFTDRGHVALRAEIVPEATGEGADGEEANSGGERGTGHRVVISVEDTGVGIPERDQAAIFDEFVQVEDPGMVRREGTGLGLAITRSLVRGMGGDLSLRSAPGTGSCFRIEIPMEAAEPAPPLALPARVAFPAMASLNATVIVTALVRCGVEVMPVPSAGAAPVILAVDALEGGGAALAGQLPPKGAAPVILVGRATDASPALRQRADAEVAWPGTGSDLAATLARYASAPAPLRASAKQAPGDGAEVEVGPRVLMADDNATNRLLLRKMLASVPASIEIVEDGAQAVDRFAAAPFDAVFLDLSMPVMDGEEALRRIRQLPGGATVPVIAMTAHATPEAAGCRSQFDVFLTKPLRKAEMVRLILEAGEARA